MESEMIAGHDRHWYILYDDWTWWAWTVTAILLTIGLLGQPVAFIAAMAVTVVQGIVMMVRERSASAFSVQLRVAYLILLIICFVPQMRWLYWLPALGTFALVTFGYCLLARMLSLCPWNRDDTISGDLLRRTFLSRPDLSRVSAPQTGPGCAGGLCTIEAQVARGPCNAEPGNPPGSPRHASTPVDRHRQAPRERADVDAAESNLAQR
jgi:hypothetical protein